MERTKCNSSGVQVKDGTWIVSYEIFEVLMKLWEAIQRGCKVHEVQEAPEFVSNWYEVIPSIFKNLADSDKENGQAKILYSVIVATSSVEDNSECHIVVPGAGTLAYGWSYTAMAMLLSQRGCHGSFDLYDPDTKDLTKIVQGFTMNYYKDVAPQALLDSVTHILDDTFPSAVPLRVITKALAKGVVVSVKANVQKPDSRLNNETQFHQYPLQVFQQPFYSGHERRVVYNYKPRQITRNLVSCTCYNCLKMSAHPLVEEEWHHLIGFGVRPCFAVKGKSLIVKAYGFYTGRRAAHELMNYDLCEIPKLNKYLNTLPQVVTPIISGLVEHKLNDKMELWCNNNSLGTVPKRVSEVFPPFIISVKENYPLLRQYYPEYVYVETRDFIYVGNSKVIPDFDNVQKAFDIDIKAIPKGAVFLVYSDKEPEIVMINSREVRFDLVGKYKSYALLMEHHANDRKFEMRPKLNTASIFVVRPKEIRTVKKRRKQKRDRNGDCTTASLVVTMASTAGTTSTVTTTTTTTQWLDNEFSTKG